MEEPSRPADTARLRSGNVTGALRAPSRYPQRWIQAQAKADRYKDAESVTLGSDITVAELGAEWLAVREADVERGSLAYNSAAMYRRTWERYILKDLGKLKLPQVTAPVAQEAISEVAGTYGLGAAEKAKSIMSIAWRYAISKGAAASNPASAVSVRTREGQRKKRNLVNALDQAQVAELRAFIHEPKNEVPVDVRMLVELQLGTGMRIGEACAMTWSCVDLEAQTIQIQRTTIRRKGKGLSMELTKTPNSDRRLDLPDRLTELLREHKETQQWGDGMVLHSLTGNAADPNNLMGQLRRTVRKLGWTDVTSHTLRRTVGTTLLSAGVPISEVADHLGHADITTTLRAYVGRNTKGSSQARKLLG